MGMQREQLALAAGPGTRLDPPPTHHAGAVRPAPLGSRPLPYFYPIGRHTHTHTPTPTGSPSVQPARPPARPPAFLLNPQASFPHPHDESLHCMAMAPQS